MKRADYWVKSYDGKIDRYYKNYASAYRFCDKLISQGVDCGIYVYDFKDRKMVCIIGC